MQARALGSDSDSARVHNVDVDVLARTVCRGMYSECVWSIVCMRGYQMKVSNETT